MKKKSILIITSIFLLITSICLYATDEVILAKVGKAKITDHFLAAIIKNMPNQYQASLQTADGKKQLLDKMIDIKMFYHKAKNLKLHKRPEIKAEIQNLTEQLLANEYIKHIRSQVVVTDNDCRRFYEENKEEFVQVNKLDDIKEEKLQAYDDVKTNIEVVVREKKTAEKITQVKAALKEELKVEIFDAI